MPICRMGDLLTLHLYLFADEPCQPIVCIVRPVSGIRHLELENA